VEMSGGVMWGEEKGTGALVASCIQFLPS